MGCIRLYSIKYAIFFFYIFLLVICGTLQVFVRTICTFLFHCGTRMEYIAWHIFVYDTVPGVNITVSLLQTRFDGVEYHCGLCTF